MSKKAYPVNGVTYYTSDLINLNKSIIKAKTIIGDGFKVSAKSTPSMQITVASGYALYNGYTFNSTTTENITISSNTSSYPRKDVITINFNGASTNFKVYTGTPSNSPQEPSIPSTDIILAIITVGVNATSIENNSIKDARFTLGQHKINSLDEYIYALENRVTTVENGKKVEYTNKTQTDDYILTSNLVEFKDTGFKICSMLLYCNPNYLAKTKPSGQNVSIITVPYYYGIGETYNVQISIQDSNINNKFDGQIKFSKPTSSGFTIYLPNKNNDGLEVTIHILVMGR